MHVQEETQVQGLVLSEVSGIHWAYPPDKGRLPYKPHLTDEDIVT